MPMRLKTQMYKTMVRPVILYGAETWAVKEEHVKKLEVAESNKTRENEKRRHKAGIEGD